MPDTPDRNDATPPHPTSPSKVIQGPADDSWKDFWKHGSKTPVEAVENDRRKNPVPPDLKR